MGEQEKFYRIATLGFVDLEKGKAHTVGDIGGLGRT